MDPARARLLEANALEESDFWCFFAGRHRPESDRSDFFDDEVDFRGELFADAWLPPPLASLGGFLLRKTWRKLGNSTSSSTVPAPEYAIAPGDHMYFPQRRRGAVTTVHC